MVWSRVKIGIAGRAVTEFPRLYDELPSGKKRALLRVIRELAFTEGTLKGDWKYIGFDSAHLHQFRRRIIESIRLFVTRTGNSFTIVDIDDRRDLTWRSS